MIRTLRLLLAGFVLCMAFTSCSKEYSTENGGSLTNTPGGTTTGTAVFTISGAPGACTTPLISGIYVKNTALDATNTVVITVDVTTIGTYVVSTAVINGISFSGSGTFVITGLQVIVLTGNGTPAASGTFTFIPGSNGCSFPLVITDAPATPPAVFTLNGAPAACTTPVIAGNYLTGLALDGSNTITVTANVTTAGTYTLTTGAVNGMTFSSTGTLAVGTAQTIVLTGSGTPTAAGTNSFTVGTNGCSFPITTADPVPAIYTFTGAPGACSPINVAGTYTTGNALSGTANTATVEANVTTAGVYTITTNTANGMTFSKTGFFASTGTQSVVLAGSGIPTAAGTNTFTVGTGGCTFDITTTAPTSPCSGLTDDHFDMSGQFAIDGISIGAPFNSDYQVTLDGGLLSITVTFPGTNNPPAPGTYSIGPVTIESLYISGSTAITWTANSGSVYVSTDGSGNTVLEFCNVPFTGVPLLGGPNLNSTGAGKMVF